MDSIKNKQQGILLCLVIAIPAWYFGKKYPLLGGPVIAIILGMIISMLLKDKTNFEEGIKFTSKKVLQWAVILLGFGMNLSVVLKTGSQSLPIIISTISTALVLAYFISKIFNIPEKIATLIGVGSSICGGSAIAATAPVIDADDQEVAQAISVIFLFNIIAALIFPSLGKLLGFTTSNGYAFGIFAGTAINDTSSVTAAATTWDNLWNLKSATLDTAVTVKLTRTLAIIPITLGLAFIQSKKNNSTSKFNLKKVFPTFIIYFILASIITTIALNSGISPNIFNPIKQLSKFFIILAMGAIGLNTNLIDLIKNGGKPILLGLICWSGITFVSLLFQYILNIW